MKLTKAQYERELAGWKELRRTLLLAQREQRDVTLYVGGAFGWITPSGWFALRVPYGTLRGYASIAELDSLIGDTILPGDHGDLGTLRDVPPGERL